MSKSKYFLPPEYIQARLAYSTNYNCITDSKTTCNCALYGLAGRSFSNETETESAIFPIELRKATRKGVDVVPVSQQSEMFETKTEKQANLDLVDHHEIEGGRSFATIDTEE